MHHPVDKLKERRDWIDVELAELQARQNGRRAEAGHLIGQVEQQLNKGERDPAVLAELSGRVSEVWSEIERDESAIADLRRGREGLDTQIFMTNEQADKLFKLFEEHLSHWVQGKGAFEAAQPKQQEMVGLLPLGHDIPGLASQAAHVSDLVVPALIAGAMMSQAATATTMSLADGLRKEVSETKDDMTVAQAYAMESVTRAANEAVEALKDSLNEAKAALAVVVAFGKESLSRAADTLQTYVRDDNALSLQRQELDQKQADERARLEKQIASQQEKFEEKTHDLNPEQKTLLKEQLDKQIALMREEQQKRHAIERENLKKRDEPDKDR